jgi:murein DD-endopeptidase MepM/ murein hydrolase activator NlpD
VFVAKCGQSNPLSFVLRPLAAHSRLKTALGLILVLLVIIGTLISPYSAFPGSDIGGKIEVSVVSGGEVNLSTSEVTQPPLAKIDVSQNYWLLHPGVDLRAPVGTPIRSIMKGQVADVKYETYGYGKHVIVEHGNGFKSLYAHMSKVEVKVGDEVGLDTILGEIGSTGRSTGPHLHIEVYENGNKINPSVFLGI